MKELSKPTKELTEWEFFVWRHRGFGNLFLHFVSFNFFFIGIIVFFLNFNYWFLISIPLSQLIGFMGHYLFEEGGVRSRDFVSPMTLLYLIKIFYLIAIDKYEDTLLSVTTLVKNNPSMKLKDEIFYGH